jgi:hypothetical protein
MSCAVTLVHVDFTPTVVAVHPSRLSRLQVGGTMMAVESSVKAMTIVLERPFMVSICEEDARGFPELLQRTISIF